METEKFVFYDPQHLSFVKDIYIVAKKMTRNGLKMANLYRCDIYMHSEYSYINEKKSLINTFLT